MSNIIDFPGEGVSGRGGRGGGGGPIDPTLASRVERLENRMERVEAGIAELRQILIDVRANVLNTAQRQDVSDVRAECGSIKSEITYVKGRLENLPSTWQVVAMIPGSIALVGVIIGALTFFKG